MLTHKSYVFLALTHRYISWWWLIQKIVYHACHIPQIYYRYIFPEIAKIMIYKQNNRICRLARIMDKLYDSLRFTSCFTWSQPAVTFHKQDIIITLLKTHTTLKPHVNQHHFDVYSIWNMLNIDKVFDRLIHVCKWCSQDTISENSVQFYDTLIHPISHISTVCSTV